MRRPATGTAARTVPVLAVAGGLVLFAASPALAGADRVRAEGELIRYGANSQIPARASARVQARAAAQRGSGPST